MKDKPWYKSLTVIGVITAAVGFLSDPAVVSVLPRNIALAVGVVGAALAAVGVRRALPGSDAIVPDRAPDDPRFWEYTFNKDGVNPYGETADQVFRRRAEMDKTARDNRGKLMGPHYTPPRSE